MQKLLNFINNEYVSPKSQSYLPNYMPATGEIYSELADSDASDVQMAFEAAQKAFPAWAKLRVQDRASYLNRLADLIDENSEKLAKAESIDQGKPYWLAKEVDIPRAASNFRFFANQILLDSQESYDLNGQALSYVIRKPVGVVGLISPWNLPLYLLTWKIAPAIAVGNTCICKPSEMTSMTAFMLGELIKKAEIPAGVINIILGLGSKCGEAIVTHPKISLISFTGGTVTGKKIMQQSAPYVKKLGLELGGKNANIIFSDCDFESTLKMTLRSSFLNQGEICLCGSRILVEEPIYDKFVKEFVAKVRELRVGDPQEKRNFLGALVSKEHLAKVKSYVELAQKEGGKIETGLEALDLPEKFKGGYFMRPTVITGLNSHCRVMQEEIFGPVVSIVPFKTQDEALEIANSVEYGLSASVWTENLSKAHYMAQNLEVGTVWVNTWMLRDLRVPFGGKKMSGLGREGGKHSIDFYTEMTTICVSL